MKCPWQKFRETMAEGFAIEKISSASFFLLVEKGGSCWSKVFLDLFLEGKYETIHYVMYSGRRSVYLRAIVDG